MKRPSGKPSTPKGKAGKASWKEGLVKQAKQEEKQQTEDPQEGEEEEDFEADPIVDFGVPEQQESEQTDRSKKQKFLAMVGNKQLPDFLLKEWEKSKTMKVKPPASPDQQRF